MGLGLGISTCACEPAADPDPRNPDPRVFTILDINEIGAYLIAEVQYAGCTNFEGVKILVFQGVRKKELERASFLDPHFCEGEHLSPFARFEPTRRGRNAALTLVLALA